jgi:hypothetical protein
MRIAADGFDVVSLIGNEAWIPRSCLEPPELKEIENEEERFECF